MADKHFSFLSAIMQNTISIENEKQYANEISGKWTSVLGQLWSSIFSFFFTSKIQKQTNLLIGFGLKVALPLPNLIICL
jgi:hypothetical protein